MVGLEEQDSSEKFLEELKERYNSIYNELSSNFDPGESVHSLDGWNPQLTQISNKIEQMYGIKQDIILCDFKYKMKNLGLLSDELIPTFFMRFAIEEGTWSVIERLILREMLLNNCNKLLALEKQIWIEKSANPEDAIFYLLELREFGKRYIGTFIEYWRLEHSSSNFTKFLEYFASVLVNTYLNRGYEIVEGAIRILQSKSKDFAGMDKAQYTTSWFTSAMDYISSLNADLGEYLETGELSQALTEAILTQILVQTEIRKIVKGPNLTQDEIQKKKLILETINWKNFDVDDQESIEEFKNSILHALLLIDLPDPLDQAFELVDILFKGEGIEESPEQIKNVIRDEVDLQRGMNATSILPRSLLKGSITKEALEKVLIDLKKKTQEKNS